MVRERVLMALIRRTCSNVRNSFRELVGNCFSVISTISPSSKLRDSVLGEDTRALDDFAVIITGRFRDGGIIGRGEISLAVRARLSMMVRERITATDDYSLLFLAAICLRAH